MQLGDDARVVVEVLRGTGREARASATIGMPMSRHSSSTNSSAWSRIELGDAAQHRRALGRLQPRPRALVERAPRGARPRRRRRPPSRRPPRRSTSFVAGLSVVNVPPAALVDEPAADVVALGPISSTRGRAVACVCVMVLSWWDRITYMVRRWPCRRPDALEGPRRPHQLPPARPRSAGARPRIPPTSSSRRPRSAPTATPCARPRGCELLNYEGEIAAVIGTRVRNVAPEEALAHDRLVRAGQRLRHLRPALGRPRLERHLQGPGRLHAARPARRRRRRSTRGRSSLRTRVNGEVVQEDITANLIFAFGAARRRPLALRDARARRRDPHRHAGELAPRAARRRRRGRARGRRARAQPDRRGARARAARARMPRPLREVRARPRPAPAPARRCTLSPEARQRCAPCRAATLTQQLRRRGIRNTFLGGLRPTRPDLRLLGYAHTLRYVPLREDVHRRHGAAQRAEGARSRRSAPTRCS